MNRFRLALFGIWCVTVSNTSLAESLVDATKSKDAVVQLRTFLETKNVSDVPEQPFAKLPLSKEDAKASKDLLWQRYTTEIREQYGPQIQIRKLTIDDVEMPIWFKQFGDKPKDGYSLWISMHGGGGAPKRVNDRQWENQKRLYEPQEGIYLAPRAPTDKWNLWHQSHIDDFFDRLITAMVVLEDVNPNRVYIMGYSAGGDGVYQLAPRMADRWAAAAMMAGHPNDASPLGLRNIGFALYMGGRDGAYKRNQVAEEWKTKLADLKIADPEGYTHLVTIYPDKGHWMDGEDKSSLPWMAKFNRDPFPKKIVWNQSSVKHSRFYWLAVDADRLSKHTIRATRTDASIDIETTSVQGNVYVRLNDEMFDLDQPIKITLDSKTHDMQPQRSIATLAKTLVERGDRVLMFDAEVAIPVN